MVAHSNRHNVLGSSAALDSAALDSAALDSNAAIPQLRLNDPTPASGNSSDRDSLRGDVLEKALRNADYTACLQALDNLKRDGQVPPFGSLKTLLLSALENNRYRETQALIQHLEDAQQADPSFRLSFRENQIRKILLFAGRRRCMRTLQFGWSFTNKMDPVLDGSSTGLAKDTLLTNAVSLLRCKRSRPSFYVLSELSLTGSPSLTWHCRDMEVFVHTLTKDPGILRDAPGVAVELLREEGELATLVPDCIIAALGRAGRMEQAFQVFDTFFQELGLQPTVDTYQAVLTGCIDNDLLRSVPLILEEMRNKEMKPTKGLLDTLLRFHIVAQSAKGIMNTVRELTMRNLQPNIHSIHQGIGIMRRLNNINGEAQLRRLLVPSRDGVQSAGRQNIKDEDDLDWNS